MKYRVIVQPRAERDVRQHVRWLLEQSKSPSTALRWAHGIRAKIATLESGPLRCPVDSDSAAYGEEVRVLLHGKINGVHRILFALRGREVHMLTVRHSAQRSLTEELGSGSTDEGETTVP